MAVRPATTKVLLVDLFWDNNCLIALKLRAFLRIWQIDDPKTEIHNNVTLFTQIYFRQLRCLNRIEFEEIDIFSEIFYISIWTEELTIVQICKNWNTKS